LRSLWLIASSLSLMLLAAPLLAAPRPELHYYETRQREGGRRYFIYVLEESDPFVFVISQNALDAAAEGDELSHLYGTQFSYHGQVVPVHGLILQIRDTILSAKAYCDRNGMAVSDWTSRETVEPTRRFPVTIRELRQNGRPVGSATLAWASYNHIEVNRSTVRYPSDDIVLSAVLHEFFHIVQYREAVKYPIFEHGNAPAASYEGTAEWFTDQPIPLPPTMLRRFLPRFTEPEAPRTADDLNSYAGGRHPQWFTRMQVGVLQKPKPADLYRNVIFFHHLAEKTGGDDPAAQFRKITAFLKDAARYIKLNVRYTDTQANEEFVKSVASILPGAGSHTQKFRDFFASFIAANVVQGGGGRLGYRDEGFPKYCCGEYGGETGELFVRSRGHYSTSPYDTHPPLQAEVADSDDEIRRRLNEHSIAPAKRVQPLGTYYTVLTLPDAPEGRPSWAGRDIGEDVQGITRAFVQVSGEKEPERWAAAIVTQSRGRRDQRGRGVRFSRVDDFQLEAQPALAQDPSAFTVIEDFGRGPPGVDTQRIWIGVANLDTQNRVRGGRVSYVVTPFFEPSYGDAAGEDERGTRTVSFVSSEPERESEDGERVFHPGDRVTLEVDLSDKIHEGPDQEIPEEKRSLEVRILDEDGGEFEVEEEEVRCTDAEKHTYRYAFTLPEEPSSFGNMKLVLTVRSLLKLGEKDKNQEEWEFELASIRPVVERVGLGRPNGRVFYDSEREFFRPVPSGPVEVRIVFDREMDRESPATIAYKTETGQRSIEGSWHSGKQWHGRFELPEGAGFVNLKGYHELSISARSAEGGELDGVPEREGAQPDTSHRFLIDAIPPIVSSLKVEHEGATIYDASWQGGADLRAQENLIRGKFEEGQRSLNRRVAEAPGDAGTARMSLVFSQPLEKYPKIHVNENLMHPHNESGDGKSFTGEFDLAQAKRDMGESGVIEITIDVTDKYGNRLDADPRTPTVLSTGTQHIWLDYDEKMGELGAGEGGVDRWHELADPPKMSLVIVLDASGSMEGDKMANAKSGIYGLLDGLPDGVELALLVFNGCGPPQTVGFTRDVARIRQLVDATVASGSTGYARALQEAKLVFERSAHPEAPIWRYAPFSDGEETCDGDPIAAIDDLEELIRRHENRPSQEEEPPPPPEREDEPEIECDPQQWEVYGVKVRDGNLHLDRIRMVESRFRERELADGHCEVSITVETYGVTYGEMNDDPSTARWRINSRSSTQETFSATSRDGEAAVEAVRKKARKARGEGTNLDTCRLRIDQAVKASLERNRSN
jgi:hypothetical protein